MLLQIAVTQNLSFLLFLILFILRCQTVMTPHTPVSAVNLILQSVIFVRKYIYQP